MRPIPDSVIRNSRRKSPVWLETRLARRFPSIRLIYLPFAGWQLVERSKTQPCWYHVATLKGPPTVANTLEFLASCDISTIMAHHTLNSFIAEELDAYDPQMTDEMLNEPLKDDKIEEGHKRLAHEIGTKISVVPNPGGKDG